MGKEHVKAVYCHPAYLTYMQSTSCEMQGCTKLKLESTLWGEISIISDITIIYSKVQTLLLTLRGQVKKQQLELDME